MTATRKTFDFYVPEELRREDSSVRVYGITIEGDDWVIKFFDKLGKIEPVKSHITGESENDVKSVRKLVESKLSYHFDNATAKKVASKVSNVIKELYQDGAGYAIDRIKKQHSIEAAKLDGSRRESEEGEKPVYTVKKYTGHEAVGIGELAEAVIIDGKPFFVVTINGGSDVTFVKELETSNMILRPPTKQEYPPDSAYEFESEDELMEYIRYAKEKETFYTLYRDGKKYYTIAYFVDTEPRNSTLLASYTIASYFQDKFSTVVYIWLVGDNGSGKNSIIIIYSWLGYRVFYVTGANGANIREYLGTVEEGQGTIAEDEADDLEIDFDKRKIYTTGYASGSSVPKVLEGNTRSREQRYYLPYCQKMFASESLPSMKYAKGMRDRTFEIKCVKGHPRYNAKSTKERTKSPESLRLIKEMKTLRKRLFAYRLVHFDDVVEGVEGLSISGRALELTESALRLFYKYKVTEEDEKTFNNEILPTLSSFLKERLSRRNESLEGRLYPIIRNMVQAQGETLADRDIFNFVMIEMGGKEVPNKPGWFYVEGLGIVKHATLMGILENKFNAKPDRIIILEDGSKPRAKTFSMNELDRIKASYEDPTEIKINPIEEPSDQVDQLDQVVGDTEGENKSENDQPDQPQSTTTTRNFKQNTSNDIKITQNHNSEDYANNVPYSLQPGQPGQVGQSYPIEEESLSSQVSPIALDELIQRAMLDSKGNDRGYFDIDDWKLRLMLLPVQDPLYSGDEDKAEELLYKFVEEGKVEEIEPGKYRLLKEEREGQGGGT